MVIKAEVAIKNIEESREWMLEVKDKDYILLIINNKQNKWIKKNKKWVISSIDLKKWVINKSM
jgi:hypothetical protein